MLCTAAAFLISCQTRFSDEINVTMILVIGLVILFTWGMFAAIGVMLCKHKYCGDNSVHHETSLKEAAKNLMMFVTLFFLLGLSSIFTNLLFLPELFVQQHDRNLLFTIARWTIVNVQGPALLIFQGVKLKEIRLLWHRWVTVLLQITFISNLVGYLFNKNY